MKNYPSISIIFPNFNGGNEPIDCLYSIKKLIYPKKLIEIIVIDNNSTDGSNKTIKKMFPDVKLIQNLYNTGYVNAINQGIRKSKGKYLFIANDDLEFEPSSILNLVRHIGIDSKIGIIGGKIYFKTRRNKISSTGYDMNLFTGHIAPSSNFNNIHQVQWIQGCAMLVRKSVLEKIGLLDENFSKFYFEDVDLCWRARIAGFKVLYIPQAVFWHGQSTTTNKNLSLKHFTWYKNKLRFIIKHLPLFNILSILGLHLLFIIPFRSLFRHEARFIPFIKGFVWNLVHLRDTLTARRTSAI